VTKVQDEAMTRLDSAVSEVFETMLERSCDPLEGEVDTVEGRIVARIQFTGTVDGECLLYASPATASVTAEALLGINRTEVIPEPSLQRLVERQGHRLAGRSGRRNTPLERALRLCEAARRSDRERSGLRKHRSGHGD